MTPDQGKFIPKDIVADRKPSRSMSDIADEVATRIFEVSRIIAPMLVKPGQYLGDRDPTLPVTPERIGKINHEVAETAKLYNEFGRPWFLGGSLSLELRQGGITRDHHDIDVELDVVHSLDFYRFAKSKGYEFYEPKKNKRILSQKEYRKWRQVVAVKTYLFPPGGPEGIDIYTFRRDRETNDVFSMLGKDIVFPASIYDNPEKIIAINGEEVPLSPREVQMLYKLFWYGSLFGRQKDIYDIRTFLPQLKKEELHRLHGYFEQVVSSLETYFK